jgi:DNA invertase Pin-like site-specific DNA recombinase
MVLNILASVAQWEREAIGERTSAALRAKQARGEHVGRAPFGWARVGGELVPVAHEQEVVQYVRTLRGEGFTYRAIQARLTTEGVATRSGAGVFSLATLRLMADGDRTKCAA